STPAAEVIVRHLGDANANVEVRESAANALQSMGKTAASALASYISATESPEGVTKAITVLAKIGKDVADDEEVRKALLARARAEAKSWDVRADKWKRLQVQLAAIDALGEINKYRGGIVDKEVSTVFSATDVAPSFVQKLANGSDTVSQYL